MLAENQIKRLLKQIEKNDYDLTKDTGHTQYDLSTPALKRAENFGWWRALRLVLEKSNYPISNKPLPEDSDE